MKSESACTLGELAAGRQVQKKMTKIYKKKKPSHKSRAACLFIADRRMNLELIKAGLNKVKLTIFNCSVETLFCHKVR